MFFVFIQIQPMSNIFYLYIKNYFSLNLFDSGLSYKYFCTHFIRIKYIKYKKTNRLLKIFKSQKELGSESITLFFCLISWLTLVVQCCFKTVQCILMDMTFYMFIRKNVMIVMNISINTLSLYLTPFQELNKVQLYQKNIIVYVPRDNQMLSADPGLDSLLCVV